jgi:hypothetical protein
VTAANLSNVLLPKVKKAEAVPPLAFTSFLVNVVLVHALKAYRRRRGIVPNTPS